MSHLLKIDSLDGIEASARDFINAVGENRLIAFYAPMGAGKTTFTTALCRVLGVKEDTISSPTFSIVNEYRDAEGEPIYHFDFYRISRLEEALDIGFYDYIDSGYFCFMEWPENIEAIIPDEALKVYISVEPDGSRILRW